MEKFEYRTLIKNPISVIILDQDLKTLGEEGWELVGIIPSWDGYYPILIFKRKVVLDTIFEIGKGK